MLNTGFATTNINIDSKSLIDKYNRINNSKIKKSDQYEFPDDNLKNSISNQIKHIIPQNLYNYFPVISNKFRFIKYEKKDYNKGLKYNSMITLILYLNNDYEQGYNVLYKNEIIFSTRNLKNNNTLIFFNNINNFSTRVEKGIKYVVIANIHYEPSLNISINNINFHLTKPTLNDKCLISKRINNLEDLVFENRNIDICKYIMIPFINDVVITKNMINKFFNGNKYKKYVQYNLFKEALKTIDGILEELKFFGFTTFHNIEQLSDNQFMSVYNINAYKSYLHKISLEIQESFIRINNKEICILLNNKYDDQLEIFKKDRVIFEYFCNKFGRKNVHHKIVTYKIKEGNMFMYRNYKHLDVLCEKLEDGECYEEYFEKNDRETFEKWIYYLHHGKRYKKYYKEDYSDSSNRINDSISNQNDNIISKIIIDGSNVHFKTIEKNLNIKMNDILKLIKKYDLHIEDTLCFNPSVFHIKNKSALLYEELDKYNDSHHPFIIHHYEASILIVNLENA